MLDHLSYGRLEVGVGRGVSPFELKYHKVEHDQSREIFIDAYKCISAGLTTDQLSYAGPHFNYANVPIALRPLQQPHPAVLVRLVEHDRLDLGGRAGAAFRHARPDADRQGEHRRLQGGVRQARPRRPAEGGVPRRRRHRRAAAHLRGRHGRGGAPLRQAGHGASISRNINWLRAKHGATGLTSRLNVPRGADFEECVADGTAIAGSPETVRAEIERQVAELGVNYLLTYLFLGDDVARRCAALAAAVLDRGDAEDRAFELIEVRPTALGTTARHGWPARP